MGIVKWQDAKNRPAVVGVVIGDPIDNAPDGFCDGVGLMKGCPGHGKGMIPYQESSPSQLLAYQNNGREGIR
jgi:hypothetical protein